MIFGKECITPKNKKKQKQNKNHKNLKCVPALIGDHWYQETKCGFKLGTVLKMHRNCGSFICFGGFCVLGKPHCIFISEISWAGWSSWNSIGKFQYVQIYLYNYTSFHTNYMKSFFFFENKLRIQIKVIIYPFVNTVFFTNSLPSLLVFSFHSKSLHKYRSWM